MSVVNAPYPHEGWTRTAIVNTISPTLTPPVASFLNDTAVDVTCDLPLRGGLDPNMGTGTVDRTPWTEGPQTNAPTRPDPSFTLTGLRTSFQNCPRHSICDDGTCTAGSLWGLANPIRGKAAMYIRRGVPADEPWNDGDPLEIYNFWWGQRWVHPSGRDFVLFSVPIFVWAFNDDAGVFVRNLVTDDDDNLVTDDDDNLTT